ncbi:TetR/AcrR family transcriptional regulator [Streptomyces phaeochromogenes]|uniref:TetR/AcrR family transcriptional regulator n=1 Tax=Streptomyces phaeochromogenes TaxID=1923 RepID=UPI002DD93D2D|nr:TetR/AcrR family transcriptional regulator [Streptomyces phaeochromogenes]WRZ34599.1 TetR/AcrR family transcriptional regulator [Streptomyces phaeochromogenes]
MNATGDDVRQASSRLVQKPKTVREAEMVQRIVTGALRAASRRGVSGLSVHDIAVSAGVSRATVYRYFSSREAVLDCMGARLRQYWEQALREAIRADPDPDHRVRLVMQSMLSMDDLIPETKAIRERELGFVLAYVQRHFVEYIQVIEWALAPVVDRSKAVWTGALTSREAAEMLLRIVMADSFVPGGRLGGLTERVDAFRALVGGRVPDSDMRATAPAAQGPGLGLRLLPGRGTG